MTQTPGLFCRFLHGGAFKLPEVLEKYRYFLRGSSSPHNSPHIWRAVGGWRRPLKGFRIPPHEGASARAIGSPPARPCAPGPGGGGGAKAQPAGDRLPHRMQETCIRSPRARRRRALGFRAPLYRIIRKGWRAPSGGNRARPCQRMSAPCHRQAFDRAGKMTR